MKALILAMLLIELPPDIAENDAALKRFAEQTLIAVQQQSDPSPDDLFRLQLAADRPDEALRTLAALRTTANVRWEIYAKTKASGRPFPEVFREVLAGTDDRTAYRVHWTFGTSVVFLQNDLRQTLERHRGKPALPLPEAVALLRKIEGTRAFESFQPFIDELLAEDDRRRYVIENDVAIRTPDGATVCAMIVRPRAAGRLPALLNFTIYEDPNQQLSEARRTASNGYAGVEGYTRGKACSPNAPIPIEHDGGDAAAVIEWIAKQPWSDGRVGMYGGSYEGFTQWAAAKRMPKPLKALMPSVTFAPGVDFPMEGNIFVTYAYPWPFYTTNRKGLDNETYDDRARWERMRRAWYTSGRAYRDLDKIDGTPNPWFRRWLAHPRYDAWWRSLTPSPREFARIDIPVLTTTGYYDGGQLGALHYFAGHTRANPGAEHYLLIGPYDHITGQRGTMNLLGNPAVRTLRGLPLDPVAHLDVGELRYQWFDHVFKGAPRPALLKDKVNYQVMGANVWKHAPSIAAMSDRTMRVPLRGTTIVDLADRSDVDRPFVDLSLDTWDLVSKSVETRHALTFTSEPVAKPTEMSGAFSGRLELIANKKDFDFSVAVYELTAQGEQVHLSYYWSRASHVRDPSRRQLLKPGRRHGFDFRSSRLISRILQPGSRIVVMLSVMKQPTAQINYGTGKDVSDETIADAGEPLQIRWLDGSYVDVPVSEGSPP